MGALDTSMLYRKKPAQCPTCGEWELWHYHAGQCDVCFTVSYLVFRHAMNWPLDSADKKRLGLT